MNKSPNPPLYSEITFFKSFILSMEKKNWDFVWKFCCSFIINLGRDEAAAAELGNTIKVDLFCSVILCITDEFSTSVFWINLMIWGGQWETNLGSGETLTPSAGLCRLMECFILVMGACVDVIILMWTLNPFANQYVGCGDNNPGTRADHSLWPDYHQ